MVEGIQGDYWSVLADWIFLNSFISVNTADLKLYKVKEALQSESCSYTSA